MLLSNRYIMEMKLPIVLHDELHTALKFTAGYGLLFPVSCKLR